MLDLNPKPRKPKPLTLNPLFGALDPQGRNLRLEGLGLGWGGVGLRNWVHFKALNSSYHPSNYKVGGFYDNPEDGTSFMQYNRLI